MNVENPQKADPKLASMGSVFYFFAAAVAVMSFSGAASAFAVVHCRLSLDSHCHGSFSSFCIVQLHAHPLDGDNRKLPFNEYKDTLSTLEAVLGEVLHSMFVSQDLIRRLAALNALDGPLDNYVDCDDDDDSPNQYHHESFSTTDHNLRTAIERVLTTSQEMGRSAPETELAWIHVIQVASEALSKQKNDDGGGLVHRHYSMLSHPSYRYTYAASLLRAGSSSAPSSVHQKTTPSVAAAEASTTTNSVAFLQSQTQTIQQAIQQVQKVVVEEKIKLRESERNRALLIDQLKKYW